MPIPVFEWSSAMANDFFVGDRVRLKAHPPYFKTADPMPMLRPSDLVAVGEVGVILDQRPGGYWGVKFERGALLVDTAYLERLTDELSEPQGTDAMATAETGVED